MSLPATDRTEINGVPATVESLRTLALVNYGHFTSMQVEDGRVRGLDLHLQRLARSTEELFGQALDIEQTQCWMRQAAGGDARKLTLRVNVFSRALNRDRLLEPVRPDVLVTTSAARNLAPTPLRVGSVDYQREQPHIKHVATFGLFQQRRAAQARGFDDALFVDASGPLPRVRSGTSAFSTNRAWSGRMPRHSPASRCNCCSGDCASAASPRRHATSTSTRSAASAARSSPTAAAR